MRRAILTALLAVLASGGTAHAQQPASFAQLAELTASDAAAKDALGVTGAISRDGNTVVLNGIVGQGSSAPQRAAFVYEKPASGWADATQVAVLTPSDPAVPVSSIAISGDTIVIGAPSQKVGANGNQGAAYVFVRPAGGWTDAHETAELTASDGVKDDALGSQVAISGDTVAVVAPLRAVGGKEARGAAYVFEKPPAGWASETQTAELTTSDGVAGEEMGVAALSGDTLLVASPAHPVGANERQGAAYVFLKPSGGWKDSAQQNAELTASDGAAHDEAGFAAAFDGDTVVLGAPFRQVGLVQEGDAYVFVKPFGGWGGNLTQTAELTPFDGATGDRFGAAVDVSGNSVAVGALVHQVGPNPGQGAAYIFDRPGSTWTSAATSEEVTSPSGSTGDLFGDPIGIAGNTLMAVATGANGSAGAAIVFGKPPAITIGTPAGGATFTTGEVVKASFSCEPPSGSTIASCSGAGVVDTSTLGLHTFTVDARTSDGVSASRSVTYTVAAVPPVPLSISGLRQSAKRWRLGGKGGTTFSFKLNKPARVALSFTRRGRVVGTVRRAGHPGLNRVRFRGRISRTRKLAAGRYSLRVTATAAGERTRTRALKFRIVR